MAHTRAAGPWPLQMLFVGCGVAVGDDMVTHDLAVPGQLARTLATQVGRGVETDVVVDPEMTPTTALATLSRIRLSQYDAVVLMLGEFDVMELTPIRSWSLDLNRLIGHIRDNTPAHNEVFIVTVPTANTARITRPGRRVVVDHHSRRLNAAIEEMCTPNSHATIVPFTASGDSNPAAPRTADTYRRFARELLGPISDALNTASGSSQRRVDVSDERARQQTVDQLGILSGDAAARLNRITELAQQAFGTKSAAVTIIDGQWQTFASRRNIEMTRTPRNDAFCSLTILGRDAIVIPDASIDPRFISNPLVTGEMHLRFYAGYPIEAPNGERIGALCVLHDQPMQFTDENLVQLRTLALFAQDELWSEGYNYEREFAQRTGDTHAKELSKSGFQLR